MSMVRFTDGNIGVRYTASHYLQVCIFYLFSLKYYTYQSIVIEAVDIDNTINCYKIEGLVYITIHMYAYKCMVSRSSRH
jgi:hypothetical protein